MKTWIYYTLRYLTYLMMEGLSDPYTIMGGRYIIIYHRLHIITIIIIVSRNVGGFRVEFILYLIHKRKLVRRFEIESAYL